MDFKVSVVSFKISSEIEKARRQIGSDNSISLPFRSINLRISKGMV